MKKPKNTDYNDFSVAKTWRKTECWTKVWRKKSRWNFKKSPHSPPIASAATVFKVIIVVASTLPLPGLLLLHFLWPVENIFYFAISVVKSGGGRHNWRHPGRLITEAFVTAFVAIKKIGIFPRIPVTAAPSTKVLVCTASKFGTSAPLAMVIFAFKTRITAAVSTVVILWRRNRCVLEGRMEIAISIAASAAAISLLRPSSIAVVVVVTVIDLLWWLLLGRCCRRSCQLFKKIRR